MRGGWRGSRVDVFSSFLASKSYQNINFDQIKDRDINLVIIYLIFDQKWNFLATHVDARSQKWWFFTFFGTKQPMRRELANSPLKAKIQMKQIGGFTKSLSEYGRVWTWIAYFLKLIPNMNMKISISRIFENVNFFLLNPHRAFACMRGGWRGSRLDVFSDFSSFFGLKKLPEYQFRSSKRQGHKSGDYLSHFWSKLKFSYHPCRRKKSKMVIFYFIR